MTYDTLLTEGTEVLKKAGIEEAMLDARYLLLDAFKIDEVHFLTDRYEERDSDAGKDIKTAEDKYRAAIKQRSEHVPLQYIIGKQDFMGLEFEVDEHVLIPRQDTETLVEAVLDDNRQCKDISVLDMCTGSGCIAVSLKKLGGFAAVTGTDISEEALKVAKKNAGNNGVDIKLIHSDMFEKLSGCSYDIIVSNPPYIPTDIIKTLKPEVRDFEPFKALDGEKDGLCFYRLLAAQGKKFLRPGGRIYLEIGFDQAADVSKLLDTEGFSSIRVIKDLPGLDRVVYAEYKTGDDVEVLNV